jgi:hypothetical protein
MLSRCGPALTRTTPPPPAPQPPPRTPNTTLAQDIYLMKWTLSCLSVPLRSLFVDFLHCAELHLKSPQVGQYTTLEIVPPRSS